MKIYIFCFYKAYLVLIFIMFLLSGCVSKNTHTNDNITKVILIEHPIYSTPNEPNNISHFLMKKIFEELNLDFVYEYATRLEALQKIDDEENAIMFPFVPPRNFRDEIVLSNRILLSEPILYLYHHVFYDKRIDYSDVITDETIVNVGDLKPFIVGSHARYKHETNLRRFGLTIHYSKNNLESFRKLINGQVNFVIEEKIVALRYLNQIDDENISNISHFLTGFFPEEFFAIAPIINDTASNVLLRINELLNQHNFITKVLDEFYQQLFQY